MAQATAPILDSTEAPLAIGQSNVRSARILQTSTCFAPISFPLFQGVRFGGGRIEFSCSIVILLELSEDGMVRRMPDPLNYGSFREWCRHRLGLGTDKGRCLCRVGPGNFTPSLSQIRT